jgi:phage gp29-like protein
MNPTGQSQFNQARIEWAIRLRYSPMPELNTKWVAANLNAFRIGELRVIGKIWEIMMERDGELAVNADKRAGDLAGLDWKIVSDGSAEGDEHAAALSYFYRNLRVTRALDQDVAGGVSELLHQMASAHSYYYSVHEILLLIDNGAAREATAELRHTPVWFFESRRGYLGYLQHIFDVYGQPCLQGEWLTCVGSGWMRPLSMAYVLKNFPLRDWMVFCSRYGSGFLEGITDAQRNDPAWEEAREALERMANDGVVLHNRGVTLKFLETPAKSALPFEPLVEHVNRLYAKCYRGIDLATGSRATEPGQGRAAVGASVQKEESGIFLARDAAWATGYLNERLDRPVIRFLFDREPRAWMAVVPPLDDTSEMDLRSVQTLAPMGLRISLAEAYKRFRWTAPQAGEPCLVAPVTAISESANGESVNGKNPAKPPFSPQQSTDSKLTDSPISSDPAAQRAVTTDATPIGSGADPRSMPQSASPNLPDAQVDAANFWSAAATGKGEN